MNSTTVQVVLVNGNSWTTSINTDFAGACNYYFESGGFEQPDESVSQVSRVAMIDPAGQTVEVMTAKQYFND